jgi:hypothetical protein
VLVSACFIVAYTSQNFKDPGKGSQQPEVTKDKQENQQQTRKAGTTSINQEQPSTDRNNQQQPAKTLNNQQQNQNTTSSNQEPVVVLCFWLLLLVPGIIHSRILLFPIGPETRRNNQEQAAGR